jgi:hypothetical protein
LLVVRALVAFFLLIVASVPSGRPHAPANFVSNDSRSSRSVGPARTGPKEREVFDPDSGSPLKKMSVEENEWTAMPNSTALLFNERHRYAHKYLGGLTYRGLWPDHGWTIRAGSAGSCATDERRATGAKLAVAHCATLSRVRLAREHGECLFQPNAKREHR